MTIKNVVASVRQRLLNHRQRLLNHLARGRGEDFQYVRVRCSSSTPA